MNRLNADSFTIMKEFTLEYGPSSDEKLYLMLTKQAQQYFIVVDSRTIRVGQCQVTNYKSGLEILEQIFYKMSKLTCIHTAYKTLDIALSFDSVNLLIFFVQVSNRKISFTVLMALKTALRFETRPLFPDMELWTQDSEVTIEIYFEGYGEPIGKFEKVCGSQSQFCFIPNDVYFNRI